MTDKPEVNAGPPESGRCDHKGGDRYWCSTCQPARQTYGPDQAVGGSHLPVGHADPEWLRHPLCAPSPATPAERPPTRCLYVSLPMPEGCGAVNQAVAALASARAEAEVLKVDVANAEESLAASRRTVTKQMHDLNAALARAEAAEKEQASIANALDEFAPHHTGKSLAESVTEMSTKLRVALYELRAENRDLKASLVSATGTLIARETVTTNTVAALDELKVAATALFDAGFSSTSEDAQVAADRLREVLGFPAGGVAGAAIRALRAELAQERDEALRKQAAMAKELTASLAELAAAKAALSLVATKPEGVWLWQGNGDDPKSLACPVVMDAETLRGLMAALGKYGCHLPSCDSMKHHSEGPPFECTCGLAAAKGEVNRG